MCDENSFLLTGGLVHSWVNDALTYFTDDVRELQVLQAEQQEMDVASLKAEMKEALSEVESIVAPQRHIAPSFGSAPTRKPNKTRQNVTRGNSTLSRNKSDPKFNLECKRLVAERLSAFEALRALQPFRRQIARYQTLLQEIQRKFRPIRAREESEYIFFVSRPEESYTMDDVVTTNERAAAADASNENTNLPDSSQDGRDLTTTGTISLTPPGTADRHFCIASDSVVIDAGRFAQEYNEALNREYGYKPILSGRKAFAASEDDLKTKNDQEQAKIESQRTLLGTHRPGIDHVLPEIFPPKSSWQCASWPEHQGAVKAIELASTAADRMTLVGLNTASHSQDAGSGVGHTAVVSSDSQKAHSATVMEALPSLPSLSHCDDARSSVSKRQEMNTLENTSVRSSKKMKIKAPSSQSTACKTGHTTGIKNNITRRERRGDLPMGVECSANNREISLRTVTGRPTSIVVRFTNRNKQRMHFRIKPSTHAWLHYACTDVAPVSGSSIKMRRDVTTNESHESLNDCPGGPADGIFLSCGGYIEVTVLFKPMDISTQKIESTLSIGITRELNSLSMEGSQWKFLEVAVNCETLLPAFRLYHMLHQPVGDERIMASKHRKQVTIPELSGSSLTCCTSSTATSKNDSPEETRAPTECTPPQMIIKLKGFPPKSTSSTASSLTAYTLSSLASTMPLDECVFPPTFVLSSATQRYLLVNIGSNAVVSFTCSSEAYTIHPSGPVMLAHAGALEISIIFRPMEWKDPCDGELVLTVRNYSLSSSESQEAGVILKDGNAVLLQQCFPLRGTAIVPRVVVRQIGDMTLPQNVPLVSSVGTKESDDSRDNAIPHYFIPDTCPEVRSTLSVRVLNSCALPLPYRWVLEVCGGVEGTEDESSNAEKVLLPDAASSVATIQPSRGTMVAMEESVFTVSVNPSAARKLTVSCSLFLEGLPNPALVSSAELARVPSWILTLYNRHAQIPSAFPTEQSVRPRCGEEGAADGALSAVDVDCAFTDPFAFFQAHTLSQPSHLQDLVFSTGFYLFAFPTEPSLRMISGALDGTFESLTGLEVSRCVTLQNPSPRALHFLWNTPEIAARLSGADTAAMSMSGDRELLQQTKDPISIWCRPREGCIPAHGRQDIAVSFIAHIPGIYSKTLECSVPELHSRYELALQVKGVGPTVHTSTQFLDFGVIKVGTRHAAIFTLLNTNPVLVVCSFRDPLSCDPPRFIFPQASVHLAANDSAEVTVYRNAIAPDIPETFFEVVVYGGEAIAIETHAIVQNPQIILDDPVVDFGCNIPEGVWQEKVFHLSNNSDFDIAFTMAATSAQTSWVRLECAPCLVLCAGKAHMEVPVRACFFHNPKEKDNLDGYCAHLEIQSQQTQQVLLVKVTATTIEQLSVSVDVLNFAKPQEEGKEVCNYTGKPCDVSQFEISIKKYVNILLLNALEMALDAAHLLRTSPEFQNAQCIDTAVPNRDAGVHLQFPTNHGGGSRGMVVRPFCEDVQLHTELPDHTPVCSETLMVRFKNYSKCTTRGVVWVAEGHSSTFSGFDQFKGTPTLPFSTNQIPLDEHDNSIAIASRVTHGGKVGPGGGTEHVLCSPSSQLDGKKASIPIRHTERVSITASKWLRSAQVGFWTTEMNGVAARRRAEQAVLAGTQRLLLDGNGCSIELPSAIEAGVPIGPLEEVALPLLLHANLPGRYDRTLQIACEGLPRTTVGLSWGVFGHPLVLDPTTAGLTKDENGHDVLLMTPVVAFLGSSHRVLRLINRLPREVCASVEVHLSTSSFSILAVNEDVEASQVVLTLGTVPESARQSDAVRYGAAGATPSSFHMPALSTKEIYIEYMPSAKFVEHLMPRSSLIGKGANSVGDTQRAHSHPNRCGGVNQRVGSYDDITYDEGDGFVLMQSTQEVDWNGCLVINCKLADSPFNDMFIIDEFYEQNQGVYPSERELRRYSCTTERDKNRMQKISAKMPMRALQKKKNLDSDEPATVLPTSLRLVPVLQLFQPLRTRPGNVVRSSKLIEPPAKEKQLLDSYFQNHCEAFLQQSTSLGSSPIHSASYEHPVENGTGNGIPESDTDTESDSRPENSESTQLFDKTGAYSVRSLPIMLAEDRERRELLAYLKRRRLELTEESALYFNPIELRLRARCGVPRLMLDPPVAQVEFQPYHNDGRRIMRTVRVMNPNTASLRFYFQLFTQKGPSAEGAVGEQYNTLFEEPSDIYGGFMVISAERLCSEEETNSPVAAIVDPGHRVKTRPTRMGKGRIKHSRTGASTPPSAWAKGDREAGGDLRAHLTGATTTQERIIHELQSFESLDVTVAYLPPVRPFSLYPATSVRDVWGCVRVEFIPSEVADSTLGGGGDGISSTYQSGRGLASSFAFEQAPVQEILLHVPLVVPKLSCDVSSLCFRPGNTVLDGREQQSYSQHFTLYNHASIAVEYEIALSNGMSSNSISFGNIAGCCANDWGENKTGTSSPRALVNPSGTVSRKHSIGEKIDALHNMPISPMLLLENGGFGNTDIPPPTTTTTTATTTVITMGNESSSTVQGSIAAVTAPVVRGSEAADRFVFTPLKGCIPAATAGGQPGAFVVDVTFNAYSNVVYESTFVVIANRQPSGLSIKLTGISRDTEL